MTTRSRIFRRFIVNTESLTGPRRPPILSPTYNFSTLVGAPLPALIERSDHDDATGTELTVALPPPAEVLHRVALEEDAEAALRGRESVVVAAAPSRSVEALCEAYGLLGLGRRRYQVA